MALPPAVPTDSSNLPKWMRDVAGLVNFLRGRAAEASGTARPSSPYEGQVFFDSDLPGLIYWDGSGWKWAGTNEAAP